MDIVSSSPSLTTLDARARLVFREIVESYLNTGLPVGSAYIARKNKGQSGLSSASIRNTMADLAELGLLTSAHISAGRLPTHQGLRLFVDGLLELGDVGRQEKTAIETQLSQERSMASMFVQASTALSGLVDGAGLVLAPDQNGPLRHIEFVGLDGGQALVVLVYEDGHVENRIMNVPPGLIPAALERAGNYLSHRLRGKKMQEARQDILREIEAGRSDLETSAAQLVKQGLAEWSGGGNTRKKRNLIVRGVAKLLDNEDIRTDLERVRLLFEDIERKEELIALLDSAEQADGVRIFIGAENPLFSLSGSSVVVAPYRDKEQKIIGAIGVIGPTRLNYARVIPLVDYTASVIGRMLEKE